MRHTRAYYYGGPYIVNRAYGTHKNIYFPIFTNNIWSYLLLVWSPVLTSQAQQRDRPSAEGGQNAHDSGGHPRSNPVAEPAGHIHIAEPVGCAHEGAQPLVAPTTFVYTHKPTSNVLLFQKEGSNIFEAETEIMPAYSTVGGADDGNQLCGEGVAYLPNFMMTLSLKSQVSQEKCQAHLTTIGVYTSKVEPLEEENALHTLTKLHRMLYSCGRDRYPMAWSANRSLGACSSCVV